MLGVASPAGGPPRWGPRCPSAGSQCGSSRWRPPGPTPAPHSSSCCRGYGSQYSGPARSTEIIRGQGSKVRALCTLLSLPPRPVAPPPPTSPSACRRAASPSGPAAASPRPPGASCTGTELWTGQRSAGSPGQHSTWSMTEAVVVVVVRRGVLTEVPLKPLLIGTKMVKGPKFCRGHETEPVGMTREGGQGSDQVRPQTGQLTASGQVTYRRGRWRC